MRLTMSENPSQPIVLEKGQITYRSLEREDSKKSQSSQNIAAWCCLHSKQSRTASVESKGAQRGDSDNASSGCSVF
jgi:hypothetical protein